MKSAPVYWENGTFLAPQVFQQADRYLEAQLRFLRRPTRGLSCGILDVVLDPTALSQWRLKLSSCQAVLPPPDGAIVDVPLIDVPPKEREFSMPSGAQIIEIFLTLPATSTPGRTRVREEAVSDLNDGTRQRRIKTAEKALDLTITGEPLNNLTALKIAEVERSAQTGKPVLRASYIPTCLIISAAPALLQLTRGLLNRAEGLLRELPTVRKQRRMDDFLFLQAIQLHLPALRHVIEDAAENVHPAHLYELLLRLSGGLCAFSDAPMTWPRYDHQRLDRCFPQLVQITETLLGCRPAPDDVKIRLKRKNQDSSIWRERLDPLPAADVQVLLALHGDIPIATLIAELEKSGKIAAGTKILRAANDFTVAVPFRHETRLPERLLAQGGIYYVIDTKNDFFAEVLKTGEIGVYIPSGLLADKEPTVEIVYLGSGGRP